MGRLCKAYIIIMVWSKFPIGLQSIDQTAQTTEVSEAPEARLYSACWEQNIGAPINLNVEYQSDEDKIKLPDGSFETRLTIV